MLSSNEQQKHKTKLSMLPYHVAIIMDGNGRWAQRQGKLRIFGHRAGVQAVRNAINFALSHRLGMLTLYAFSSENWKRPLQEISALMDLFILVLNNESQILHKHNIRLHIIGDKSRFTSSLQESIYNSEKLTCNNDGLTLNIAANYGGRWDITQGVKKIIDQIQKGIIKPDQIDENVLCQYICMNKLISVDLLIRTGGEHRISNFLLWQIAYAELFFTDVLWPDFNDIIFNQALHAFTQRERRFGTIKTN